MIKIQGITLSGNNITISSSGVFVDGKKCQDVRMDESPLQVDLQGDPADLVVTGNVTVNGDVHGYVDASGNVDCGDVGGYVDAGGNVVCKDVRSYVDAGGNVVCTKRR